MTTIDWLIVGAYFAIATGIAMWYYRRASRNTFEFFLGGRRLPWFLAGTSMVATTFAADTPLAVTEFVAANGIAGNWIWWNFAFGGMLTVFFFARLWRRSGITTDVEFVEVRYAGTAAAVLRGIKAVYFGLLMNVLIIAWVSLAMETIVAVLFPDLTIFGQRSIIILDMEFSAALIAVSILVVVVSLYALLSGLWGIVVTDAFQFCIAMTGSVLMAIFVLRDPAVGGMQGLMSQLPPETFSLLPSLQSAAGGAATMALTVPAFIAFIGIQWWSSWYPGAEPGGGGYIAQRMISARTERDSMLATLLYTIAHYCLRPWPWIVVALASMVLYPGLADTREGFVLVMRDVLPAGILGLMVAAFLAAFMSTISTQLNWGVSYLIHDGWRRFLQRDKSEKYYVVLSRVATFVVALISIAITTQLSSIREAWELILTASAGLGLVLVLRWYWWRINAWSELVATIAPILMVGAALAGVPIPGLRSAFPTNLFTVVAITTALWVGVTFATRPTRKAVLQSFYARVTPPGPGWRPLESSRWQAPEHLGPLVMRWAAGVVLVYSVLFLTGYILLSNKMGIAVSLTLAIPASTYLWRSLRNS